MPGNRLTLSVGVGRQVDIGRALGHFLQLGQRLTLAPNGDVFGRKAVLDVDTELALGQIPQVTHGRLHRVTLPEVFPDRSCLCR